MCRILRWMFSASCNLPECTKICTCQPFSFQQSDWSLEISTTSILNYHHGFVSTAYFIIICFLEWTCDDCWSYRNPRLRSIRVVSYTRDGPQSRALMQLNNACRTISKICLDRQSSALVTTTIKKKSLSILTNIENNQNVHKEDILIHSLYCRQGHVLLQGGSCAARLVANDQLHPPGFYPLFHEYERWQIRSTLSFILTYFSYN